MTTQSKAIPAPGSHPNTKADALHIFSVLQSGGAALVPTEAGYALMASSTEAIEKSLAAKRRRSGHSQAFIESYRLLRALRILLHETIETILALRTKI